ncbi:hypothetical protein DUNSADRAFT_15174, partial [Dunaliella salina]
AYSGYWAAYYSTPQGHVAQEFQQRVAEDPGFAGTEQYHVFYEDWCATELEAYEQAQQAAAAVKRVMVQAAVPQTRQKQQQRRQQAESESTLVRGQALAAAIRTASLHSNDTQLVKGALVAGMYPQVALVRLLKRESAKGGGPLMQPVRATDPAFMEVPRGKDKKERRPERRGKEGSYKFELRTLQVSI